MKWFFCYWGGHLRTELMEEHFRRDESESYDGYQRTRVERCRDCGVYLTTFDKHEVSETRERIKEV